MNQRTRSPRRQRPRRIRGIGLGGDRAGPVIEHHPRRGEQERAIRGRHLPALAQEDAVGPFESIPQARRADLIERLVVQFVEVAAGMLQQHDEIHLHPFQLPEGVRLQQLPQV